MIDWQETILAIKRATKKTYPQISKETGVSKCVLESMGSGRHCNKPNFDNGFALLCYAQEVGADLTRARII